MFPSKNTYQLERDLFINSLDAAINHFRRKSNSFVIFDSLYSVRNRQLNAVELRAKKN